MERGFWAVPKSIANRKDLSYKAKLIAGILWSMRASKSGAFPSRNYMAKALGVSTATIDRGLKELKEKARLRVKRRGFGRTNCYHIPDWTESSKMNTSEKAEKSTLEETELNNVEKATETTIIDNHNRNINNKHTKVDDEKSSSVKEIFQYFRSKVRKTKGFDPEISWAKDGRMIKLRLKKYGKEQVKELIDWFLNSEFSEKLSVSLSVCLSTHVINLWKMSKASQPHYPLWKPP